MSKTKLSLINLSVEYAGGFVALCDINFDLDDGEVAAVTGPIGSGKATLLKASAGLLKYSGSILYDGKDIDEMQLKKRNFTFASHDSPLFHSKNAFDNIAYGLKIRKYAAAEINQRVLDTAKVFDIKGLLNKKIKHLSETEKRLVIAARAFVRDSDLYLLNDLDFALNKKDAALLNAGIKKQLHAKTAIITSGDFNTACFFADRIVLLNKGVIEMQGGRDEFLNAPANKFCELFVRDFSRVCERNQVPV